jgi:hypothetical protein
MEKEEEKRNELSFFLEIMNHKIICSMTIGSFYKL